MDPNLDLLEKRLAGSNLSSNDAFAFPSPGVQPKVLPKAASLTPESYQKELTQILIKKDPDLLLMNLWKLVDLRLNDVQKITQIVRSLILVMVACLNPLIGNKKENRYIKHCFALVFAWIMCAAPDIFYLEIVRFVMMTLCVQKNGNPDPKKNKLKVLLHPEVLKLFFPNVESQKLRIYKLNKLLVRCFIQNHAQNSKLDILEDHILENFYRELDPHFLTRLGLHYAETREFLGLGNLTNFLLEKCRVKWRDARRQRGLQELDCRCYLAIPMPRLAKDSHIQQCFKSNVHLCFAIPQGKNFENLNRFNSPTTQKIYYQKIQIQWIQVSWCHKTIPWFENEDFKNQEQLFQKYPPSSFTNHLFYFKHLVKEKPDGELSKEIQITIYDFNDSDFASKSFWMKRFLNPYNLKENLFHFEWFTLFGNA